MTPLRWNWSANIGGSLKPGTRGASRARAGPLGRQLIDTLVEHRSLAPSPPWAGRDGEGRSGSKGGEGPARGGNRCPPRRRSLFSRPSPASSAATISKMPLKPLLLLGQGRHKCRPSSPCAQKMSTRPCHTPWADVYCPGYRTSRDSRRRIQ
jgi:hypothetical protein